MSSYYTAKRTRGLYKPKQKKPFALSRSKIDLFRECPRCFYLDRRLGISRPPGYPFNLNSAVDTLLKKEFDTHRASSTAHPLMKTYGVDAVPYQHTRMDEWRDTFQGVRHIHAPTNLEIFGAVDDIWINPAKELIVVDYKATSKNGTVTIDAPWQDSYKRQMEVYQWLLRRNGFTVSDTGHFVYCNGKTDRQAFDGKLEFDVALLPYTGSDGWIENTLAEIKAVLDNDITPESSNDCDFCQYRLAITEAEQPNSSALRSQLKLI